MRNPTKTKSWQKILAHPRVLSAWDETVDEVPSLWAELRPGWAYEGTHCVHRESVAALLRDVVSAEPCDCEHCAEK
jgi:hypothetical protein